METSTLNLINTRELCEALNLTRDQFRAIEKQLPRAKTLGASHHKTWTLDALPDTILRRGKPLKIRAAAGDYIGMRIFRDVGPLETPAPVQAEKPKAKIPAIRTPITAEEAGAKQIICQQARLSILAAIRKSVATGIHRTELQAFKVWLSTLAKGNLSPQQVLWCALANDKNGFRFEVSFTTGAPVAIAQEGQDIEVFAKRLGKRSLQRWMQMWKSGGDEALIPKVCVRDMSVPPWAPYFLARMQRPQKPAIQTAYDEMAKQLAADGWSAHIGNGKLKAREFPDYTSVTRWYRHKYSKLDARKGRNTGSALNPFKFYRVRTVEGMDPLQEVHSDGWATKFYAPHPISGKWVTGEVWHSHDVATRKVYVRERSIGLSENTSVILGSLYAVCVEDGVPLFWQTDNTGAVKNDRVEFDPAASISARLNIQIVHNLPGNSQANGIAESFNRYLQERSKELATYKGGDQDAKTQNRIHKITNKLTKAASTADAVEFQRLRSEAEKVGCGVVFTRWDDAVAWCKRVVAEFNDMPHRTLPKITDASGKRRHMTPNERMAEFVAAGWQPSALAGDDLVDAFLVHEVARVTRGCVSVMGQRYHHAELDHHNGEDVLVAYDIEDGSQVHIKDIQGVSMYVAKFCEARNYRMQSFVEIAQNRRADRQLKRLDVKKGAIEAQRPGIVVGVPFPGQVIESASVRIDTEIDSGTPAGVLTGPSEADIARNRRINQMEDPELARHLAAHPDDLNVHRARYLLEQARKFEPLASLLDELNLWEALWSYKKRAVAS